VGLLALVLASFGWTGSAHAAANGFKFGDGRVHPFFEFESRYDTAAILNKTGAGIADLILHFRPGLKLEMPSPKFSVNLDGNVDYLLYTGVVSPSTRDYSRLQGEANLDLGINRAGQFGFDLGDHFMRTDRVTDPTVASGVLSLYNEARAQVNLRPSGGALDLEPNYHLTTEWFSPSTGGSSTATSSADYLTHTFALNGRWKFLPKTAITVDGAFGMRNYLTAGAVSNKPLNTLKVTAGLAGLLSTHLSTVLKAGWGHDFSQNSFKTVPVIGQAELGYIISQSGLIKAGFVRTFEPVAGSRVSYTDNRVYLEGRVLLGGRLTLRASGSLDFIGYNVGGGSGTSLSGDVGVDVEVVQWLNVSAGYIPTYRNDPAINLSNFTRHEVYGRLQFIY
jgi:hypothetical protein